MDDIHSCGYYCNRPNCIKAQRNELRKKVLGKMWVGLTDDEIGHIENRTYWITKVTNSAYSLELCRSVEAKLKEKNT